MPKVAAGQPVRAVMVDLITTGVRNKRPECAICYEPFTKQGKFVELDCGHIFHEDCLAGWTAREQKCPMCRREILS
jgi:hypothetical protein